MDPSGFLAAECDVPLGESLGATRRAPGAASWAPLVTDATMLLPEIEFEAGAAAAAVELAEFRSSDDAGSEVLLLEEEEQGVTKSADIGAIADMADDWGHERPRAVLRAPNGPLFTS